MRLAEKELAAQVRRKKRSGGRGSSKPPVKLPAEAMLDQARLEAEADAYKKELDAKGKAAGVRL